MGESQSKNNEQKLITPTKKNARQKLRLLDISHKMHQIGPPQFFTSEALPRLMPLWKQLQRTRDGLMGSAHVSILSFSLYIRYQVANPSMSACGGEDPGSVA